MKLRLLLLFVTLGCFNLQGQEDIFRPHELVSPIINQDGTVTFTVNAPLANEVKIVGSWMPRIGFSVQKEALNKDTSDNWVYTTKKLDPEFYSYSFEIDGIRFLDPNNAHVIRDVSSISNVFLIDGPSSNDYKVNEVPHGTIIHPWYTSKENNKDRRLSVYLPPNYFNSEESYPVFYLLHGIGGDEEAWLGTGRAAQILDNLIAKKEAKPMIVVMPNGNVSQKAAPGKSSDGFVQPTFNLPQTMDGKFEESFYEIMDFVNKQYRTKKGKENTAIAGLSMGGYHTMYISRYYPNTFDYIGLFSPALNVNHTDHPDAKAYQNTEDDLRKQIENGYQKYWIAVGEDDFPILYNGIQDYLKKMDELGMPYEYKETPGGHTWENWRKYLVEFTPTLFK